MALFPEMPLPGLVSSNGVADLDPALPPDGTSGVLPGLDAALLELLRNYRPGDIGICEVDPKLQLSLPMPEWAWYYLHSIATSATVAASTAATVVLYTVPMDRRAWLDGVFALRSGGSDNEIDRIWIQAPEGYYVGAENQIILKRLGTAGADIIWPDPSGLQASTYLQPGPILMEPGTQVQARFTGAGVAISSIYHQITMRQTKLLQAVLP